MPLAPVKPNQPRDAETAGSAQLRPTVPFVRAARAHYELGETKSATLSSASQTLSLKVPNYGWIRAVLLKVSATTTGNAAAVAFNPDAPWNVISSLIFKDAAGTPIHVLNGWELALFNALGAYPTDSSPYASDPGVSPYYSAVTGTGANGGSFSFFLMIPVEFARDGLGILPNMDSAAQFQIDLVLAPTAAVYSTAPTNPPTVTIVPMLRAYSNPPATDVFGNPVATQPPAMGTVHYLSKRTFAVTTGSNTLLIPMQGRFLRQMFAVFRDSSGNRVAPATVPSTFEVDIDAGILYIRDKDDIYDEVYARYMINLTTTGRFSGVVPILNNVLDPDGIPGAETGDMWLPTLTTTQFLLKFSAPSGIASVDILTGDFVMVGNAYAA